MISVCSVERALELHISAVVEIDKMGGQLQQSKYSIVE